MLSGTNFIHWEVVGLSEVDITVHTRLEPSGWRFICNVSQTKNVSEAKKAIMLKDHDDKCFVCNNVHTIRQK